MIKVDIHEKRKKIEQLYQEFLKDYNVLSKLFKLNDPVEMGMLFYHLRINGYLSVDKSFDYSPSYLICDYLGLNAIGIFSGFSCCRHMAFMFNDILKVAGIKSSNFPVCSRFLKNDKKNARRKLGDHFINVAVYDDEVYYIDVTDCDFYSLLPNEKDVLLSLYDNGYEVYSTWKAYTAYKLRYTLEEYLEIRKILNMKSFECDVEALIRKFENVVFKMQSLLDEVETFYTQHKDLYAEVISESKKLYKILVKE